ncbi:hypothetical protein GGS21DRAFT_497350 [Xylaria nigripes]|nr:hypothetical protein GGS21DRAFT_497350 [Xylaria nigripes]
MSAERIRQLKQALKEAQKRAALKKRQRRLRAMASTITGTSSNESEARPTAKQQKSEFFLSMPLPSLTYKGMSRSELALFLLNLKAHFLLAGDVLKDEKSRVWYAASCLLDPAKRRWTSYLVLAHKGDYGMVSWDGFEKWLQKDVSDA